MFHRARLNRQLFMNFWFTSKKQKNKKTKVQEVSVLTGGIWNNKLVFVLQCLESQRV